MKKDIKFLGVSSGICAPTARGKMGAELGFREIIKYGNTQKPKIFRKANVEEIVSARDLFAYIESANNTKLFFNDLRPATIKKGLPRKIFESILSNKEKILADIRGKKKSPFGFLYKFIKKNRRKIAQDATVFPRTRNFSRHVKYLYNIFEKIIAGIGDTLASGQTPVVIAGDHSTAAGTIAGIRKYLGQHHPGERLGVIWIDAHVDGHSPYSTPSGNYHGMPVGIALGLNKNYAKDGKDNILSVQNKAEWERLCTIHGMNEPMLRKEELVYIGLRSWEPHEEALLKEIKHYKLTRTDETESGGEDLREGEEWNMFSGVQDMNHMKNKTLAAIVEETLMYLKNNGCRHLYVSFDIDSIDSNIVPGTGTPEPYGLGVDDVKYLLKRFWHNEDVPLIGLEMVEINPLLDEDRKTVKTAFEIIKSIVAHNEDSEPQ